MSRTPAVIALLVASMSISTAAAQIAPAFEGVVRYTIESNGRPSEVVQMIKGTKGRHEMDMPVGRMIMLQDRSAREAILLDTAHKSYRVFGGRDVPPLTRVSLTRLGGKEHIAGYDCEHFRVDIVDVLRAEVCAAKGLGIYEGGKDMPWITSNPATLRALAAGSPEFERIMKEGFVPLKLTVIRAGATSATVILATRVERRTLDDALFVVPPGYKRLEMPGMGVGRP